MNKSPGQLAIYLVSLASVMVVLFGIRELSTIINPVMLAIVITITVLPIPGKLKRRGIPGWLALVATILMVVLILILVILTVSFSVTKLFTDLPAYIANASTKLNETLSSVLSKPETALTSADVVIRFGPIIQQAAAIVGNLLFQFGIALVIFFFMISAAISLPGAARLGLNPDAPIIGRISALTEDVRRYMNILTGMNFLVGMGNAIFLWILGVDYAILWGILAWFMGYIPSIGFIIALIPPLLLAWAQYGLAKALIVLVGYILINGGVQNIIQPKIMGQGLKISPVIVFVGLFLWGFLLGGIGAIIAVPLTLLVLTIMENFENTRPLSVLMRYTGEIQEPEQQEALLHARRLWDKVKESVPLKK